MVSSIYDSLGLIFPFVLEGRQIIQLLWDDPVDEDIQQKWIKWKLDLKRYQEIKLNRCYKAKGFGKVVTCSLHYFSYALGSTYGQQAYLRLVNIIGKVLCSLVISKSQVAPMKYTSIPRLEFAAAVLSTKMSGLVKSWDLMILWNITRSIVKLCLGILEIPRKDLRYL